MPQAVAGGAESLSVDLGAEYGTWEQTVGGPQRYHAKSLAVLRAKFARLVAPGGGSDAAGISHACQACAFDCADVCA